MKHKTVCSALNYIKHFFILVSAVVGCISISDFSFSLGIPVGLINSAIGLNTCAKTSGIKKYKSIIKKI